MGMTKEELEKLKRDRDEKITEAERAAYAYFCECEVGIDRNRAHEIYENIRTARRVGY